MVFKTVRSFETSVTTCVSAPWHKPSRQHTRICKLFRQPVLLLHFCIRRAYAATSLPLVSCVKHTLPFRRSAGIVRVCGIRERHVLTCVFKRDVLISYLQENVAAQLQRLVDGYGTRKCTMEVMLSQMMRKEGVRSQVM